MLDAPDVLRAPSTAFSTSFAVRGKGRPLPASSRAAQADASASTSSAASSYMTRKMDWLQSTLKMLRRHCFDKLAATEDLDHRNQQ